MSTTRCSMPLAALFVLAFATPAAAQVLGENIALNMPASQSSQLGAFGPELGVNGNLGDFTHTLANTLAPDPEWWQVDLGGIVDVGFIVLNNRTSCCGSRLRDIIVQVLDDDGISVVFETADPLDPGDDLLNPENELGAFPLGPAGLTINVETLNGGEPVAGRFVKVLRLPDLDLSGTGGQGNADEGTVLSLGEVEVYEAAPSCPPAGDTHCEEPLAIVGPDLGDTVGLWTVTATAFDDSADIITYTFTAEHTDGTTLTIAQDFETATFDIQKAGEWTFTVTVDDGVLCDDVAADASCNEIVEIEGLPGFTDPVTGQILTKGYLVLGPFSHTFGCGDGQDQVLLGNHIANARIDCEYPAASDPIDYDAAVAVSTGYLGPEGDGIPTWRLLDDGSPENGDVDLNGDVGPRDNVMSWLVTYVENTGATRSVQICLGSDDGGQVWLDGRVQINDRRCRGRGDCDVSAVVDLEPGVHRLAAAAWNATGGWGLRLSLADSDTLLPIVDGDPDIVFHGATRPAGFTPPECTGCAPDPVRNLTCEFGPVGLGQGVVLNWENPDIIDPITPTRIEIDGVQVATVPSNATTAGVPSNLLPATPFYQLTVIHCGGVGASCTPFATNAIGEIASSRWLALGPYAQDLACTAPESLLQSFTAPTEVPCAYPEEGDPAPYSPDDAASTAYTGPVDGGGDPVWTRFADGTDDGDNDLDVAYGGPDNVMAWLVTYVEYTGAAATNVQVCFGSDDGGQVWFNDRLVINDNPCRGRSSACQNLALVDVEPGVIRIAAGAWEAAGGWGLRLALRDEDGIPIADDGTNADWVFHGTTPPGGATFPGCLDVDPVQIGDCEISAGGDIELAWTNPGGGAPITVTANGLTVASLPANAASVMISADALPFIDPITLCVDNGSLFPACCQVSRNIAMNGVADHSSQLGDFGPALAINGNLGDFTHTAAGNSGLGPAIWELDLLAPTAIAGIIIHNRDSCCASRLRDIVVSVHDLSFREDIALDPLINEVADVDFPIWEGEAIYESELLNEENELGGMVEQIGPETLSIDLSGLGIEGQYVRVTRIPDRDLSGSGGTGNADEGDVLSLGEMIVIGGGGAPPAGEFKRGDVDGVGPINITDGVYLLNFLFLGGPSPPCMDAADANDGGTPNITTGVYIFNFLFLGGPAPPAPGPTSCGPDPTGDALGCAEYDNC